MIFQYSEQSAQPIFSWFENRLAAIDRCLADHPEEALVLIYSGIDTLSWLFASGLDTKANRNTFKLWCDKHLLCQLSKVGIEGLTSADIYSARCGILHVSNSVSDLTAAGHAREVFYRLRGTEAVNIALNSALGPFMLDISFFAFAFKKAGLACLQQPLLPETVEKGSRLFRWGKIF